MQIRFVHGIISTFLLVCLGSINGCNTSPAPPEVANAETQEHELWRAGADIYAPQQYKAYKAALRTGKDHFIVQESRFKWFRDYDSIRNEFRDILSKGNDLLADIEEQKRIKLTAIESRIDFFRSRIDTLKRLTALINEGRLSRKQLIGAELILNEAQLLAGRGNYPEAEKKLKVIPAYTESAMEAIAPILNRYANKDQIAKWRTWVHDAIETSREKGIYAILVSKIDRKLVLYKAGVPYRTYSIGLGKNGFHDKLHAGDLATPEGKYFITKKLPRSRYYKALLINYPNDEDRRAFSKARKNGSVHSSANEIITDFFMVKRF